MVAPARRRVEVTGPFGGPVQLLRGAGSLMSDLAAPEDMDLVRRTLQGFYDGGGGTLRLYRPSPTAAFSPRDTTQESYAAAADAMRVLGFAPVERRAGGQLAVYDSGALVIDLVAPHAEPRNDVHARFRLFSGAIAGALIACGIDARVGEIAGEYCPGSYSVNAQGRIKLVGVAQRVVRCGYHVGAVISVMPSDAARTAVGEAYRIMGVPFDASTFGSVSELAPGLSFERLGQMLTDAISDRLLTVSP